MRDYGKFLSAMADEMNGEEPKQENTVPAAQQTPAPVQTIETETEQPEYRQPPVNSAELSMDGISLEDLPQTEQSLGFGDDYGQSDIPMQSAQPVAAKQESVPKQSVPGQGKRYGTDAYEQAGSYSSKLNDQPFVPVRERRQTLGRNSDENPILGLIGALIGGALGTAIWVVIGYAGYISFFGGLAIVAGAFFGYLLLGRGFGNMGALMVALVVIVAVFVGTRLVIGIFIRQELQKCIEDPVSYGYTQEEADEMTVPSLKDVSFTYFDSIVKSNYESNKEYHSILVKSYIFAGIAAIAFFVRRART